jgi:hypothetical protein
MRVDPMGFQDWPAHRFQKKGLLDKAPFLGFILGKALYFLQKKVPLPKLQLTLLLSFLILLNFELISYAQENTSVKIAGSPDLFTGTMNYAIPIEVPPGRKGMQPKLALTYDSSGGNGKVGIGWELQVGAIERNTKFGVNYDGDAYVLRLAGSTMDLVYVGGNDYRAKIEGSFVRIRKNGNIWEVTDKTGTRYLFGQVTNYFGQTTNSRMDGPPGIFKWFLDQVTDTNGNSMTLTYFKDQGQVYLDRIDYTYLIPSNYVKLYYEPRSDAPVMYTTNFAVTTAQRLKTIDVFSNGQYPKGNRVRKVPMFVPARAALFCLWCPLLVGMVVKRFLLSLSSINLHL